MWQRQEGRRSGSVTRDVAADVLACSSKLKARGLRWVTVGGLPLPLFALQPPAAVEHATARRRVAGLLVRVVSTQHSLTYVLIGYLVTLLSCYEY